MIQEYILVSPKPSACLKPGATKSPRLSPAKTGDTQVAHPASRDQFALRKLPAVGTTAISRTQVARMPIAHQWPHLSHISHASHTSYFAACVVFRPYTFQLSPVHTKKTRYSHSLTHYSHTTHTIKTQ
jgi:hypothetical protein